MRFWQISTFGIDSLEFAERPTPRPGPGEVLVKVRAISFNYRDLLMVKGLYNPKMRLPRVPCSDGAGEVAEVGEGVTSWKPGDRVAGIFMQNWLGGPPTPAKVKGALGGDVDGMLAEYVILKETGLVALPEHLSFEEGATLPCAAVTAWNALDAGNLDPRSTVLIQGTGGVSIFALQFAKLRGCACWAFPAATPSWRALAISVSTPVSTTVRPRSGTNGCLEETSGEGADLVIEVGGVGTLPRSLRALKMGGVVAQIGVLTGPAEPLPLPIILHKQVRIQGIYVGSRHHFEEMNDSYRIDQIRPVFESHPWTEAPDVLREMETASHFGKLVLTVA